MAEGVNESLRESSDILAKVIEQVGKISEKTKGLTEQVKKAAGGFDDMSKSAAAVDASASGVKTGGGNMLPWLSATSEKLKQAFASRQAAPPSSPGGTAAGGGGGAQPPTAGTAVISAPGPQGKAALASVAGGIAGIGAAAWSGTPGVPDAVTRQYGLFPMAQSQASVGNPVTQDTLDATNRRLRGLLGANMSGVFDDLAAANMTRYTGFGMNTPEFDQNMRTAGSLFAVSGMSNPMAMGAMTGMQTGPQASRLAAAGIFTHDLQTGQPRDLGAIANEFYTRSGLASSIEGKTVSEGLDQLETSIGGGFLGADLRAAFGDNPAQYQAVVDALRLQVQNQGTQVTYGGDPNDPNSAQSVADRLGINHQAPWVKEGEVNEGRRNSLDEASTGLYSGWLSSQDAITKFNDVVADVTEKLGALGDALYWVKGGTQGFTASGEGQSIIQGISSMFGMAFPGLNMLGKMFSEGGHVSTPLGSSTSDSIPAMLSRGEYVINSRAAQQIGVDTLDAMNSVGQELGSAFASPVRHFATGGSTDTVGSSDQSSFANSKGISQVIELAKKYANLPYSSSASVSTNNSGEPTAWGCATSVNWLYEHGAGVSLPSPSLSYDQWRGLTNTVDPSSMQPGDLIFMKNEGPSRANDNPINHVEMYLGPGEVFNGGQGIQSDSSYPPVMDGIKRVIGGSVSVRTPEFQGDSQSSAAPGVFSLSGGGGGPDALMNPMLSSQGLAARWAMATTVAPYGRRGKGAGSFIMHPLFAGGNAGGALTLFGSTVMSGVSTGTTTEDAGTEESSNIDTSVSSPSGSGPEWLYQFLVDHGLRGRTLQVAWTIGMRESGGDPSNTTHGGNENWNSDGSPYFDVGLFQINNRHLSGIKSKYGKDADMRIMLDPNRNFEYMVHMSNSFQNLSAWALEPDGQTFNWSQYSDDWVSKYGQATMENHNRLWNQYDEYNREGYSKGSWRTRHEVAQIHDGEMIIPADAAEEFRKMMREAVSGGRSGGGDVHIHLSIAQASEQEAIRFAHKVKDILKNDERVSTLRSR